MRLRERSSRLGFFGWTAAWLAVLLLPTLLAQLSSGLFEGGIWRPGQIVAQFPGWIGLFLPFAAFAGGVAGYAFLSTPSVLKRGALIAVVSYLLLAFGSPVAVYVEERSQGVDLEELYPFGPPTPDGLLAHRSAIEADPPEAYSFRIDSPLSRPPNWLTYLFHSVIALALYSILAVLLGRWSGKLTTGLSPPDRRNARWALGLAGAIAFFVAEAAGGEWVRADPSNSGVLGAWLPMLLPVVELGVLVVLTHLRNPYRPVPVGSQRQ